MCFYSENEWIVLLFFYLLRLYDLDLIDDVLVFLFFISFDLFFTLFVLSFYSSLDYYEELLELEEDDELLVKDIETDCLSYLFPIS